MSARSPLDQCYIILSFVYQRLDTNSLLSAINFPQGKLIWVQLQVHCLFTMAVAIVFTSFSNLYLVGG